MKSIRVSPELLLVLIAALLLAGCNRTPKPTPEEQEVIEAIAETAPPGGTGVKNYFYEDGGLKQKVTYTDSRITRMEYYSPEGRLLYTSVPEGRCAILITLSEIGEITEVYEAKDFIKDGGCFVMEDGRFAKVQKWDYGELISEVTVDDK